MMFTPEVHERWALDAIKFAEDNRNVGQSLHFNLQIAAIHAQLAQASATERLASAIESWRPGG